MNYTNSVSSSNRCADRRSVLDLDNILIWEVTSSNSRDYLISLQGYSEDNCHDRVMVSDGRREAIVIGKYEKKGYSLSCCSVACRMTDKEQESYNKALYNEDYEQCICDLFSLEVYLNRVYGYHNSGKVHKKKIH